MFRSSLFPGRLKKLLPVCLSLLLIISTVALSPRHAAAAVNPLPGPAHPLLYDDFAGGGLFKQNWTNWYNQNGEAALSPRWSKAPAQLESSHKPQAPPPPGPSFSR